jgi:hypothetical protein
MTSVTCSVSPCQVVIDLPILNLDTDAGALIAGAVLAIWALGFGFRALIRALNIDSNTSTSESEI